MVMDRKNEIIIPRNKFKIAFLALGAVAFVAVGIWLVQIATSVLLGDAANTFDDDHPAYTLSVGLMSIVFFGPAGLILIRKLFNNAPGLVINSEGILDNSTAVAAGFIPWDEITTFLPQTHAGKKFLVVFVRDPDRYANKGGLLKRLMNKANRSLTGSPINISMGTLKIKSDELESIFRENLRRYGDFDRC